jgi:two-component system nitrate/nitrite response regulator NarL
MTMLPTVWILEDNASFRRAVARALERSNEFLCPQQFDNKRQLLQALKLATPEEFPKILLLDVALPDGSGLDVIHEVRDRAPECHVLILTVFEDPDKITRAICNGAKGYLLKTAPMTELIPAIHQSLAGGVPMTPSIAHRVLSLFSTFAPKKSEYGLSEREKETLELIVRGFMRKNIADELQLSLHTVDTYLRRIYRKLEVNTRSSAVAKAIKEGLV